MSKRGNNEGSIRERSKGHWEARYTIGVDPATGKQIQRSISGKTQKEVIAAMKAALNALDSGVNVTADKILLGEWLNHWLWDIKRSRVKPKTFSGYLETYKAHIKNTAILKIKLRDIRRFHIQAFIDGLESAGVSPFVINSAYGIIRNAINESVRRGLIPVSYANGISLPKKQPKPTAIFTTTDQKLFLDAVSGSRHEYAFIVALTAGIREGELAALTWSDYDGESITINKNAVRISEYDTVTHEKTGSKIIIQDTPKTDAGTRKIPLLNIARQALSKHKIKQLEERLKNSALYVDNNLIFCNQAGCIYDPKTFYSAMRKIIANTPGLEQIKFHALRHTFASRALESDMSIKAVQSLLGHETPDMTMHYQHILEEQAKTEMSKLEGVFVTG
jgi:integrase